MNPVFDALFRLGERRGLKLSTVLPQDPTSLKKRWTLDLKTQAFRKDDGSRPIEVPIQPNAGRTRDASTRPFDLYDKAMYVLSPQTAFWVNTLKLLAATEPELHAAAQRLLKNPLPQADDPGHWVILTYDGVPLLNRAPIRAHVEKLALASFDEGVQDTCLITGVTGPVVRLHDLVGWDGHARLFSVDKGLKACEYNGQIQGQNFPVSVRASKLYTQALTQQLNEASVSFKLDRTIVFWPNSGTTHPVIPIALTLLGYPTEQESANLPQTWETLTALLTDATPINVLSLRKNKIRILIQDYATISAGQLAANLLRFRQEFQAIGSPNLRRTYSSVEEADQPSAALLQRMAWAILTGSHFPRPLRAFILRRLAAKVTTRWLLWMEVFLNRINGFDPSLRQPLPEIQMPHLSSADFKNYVEQPLSDSYANNDAYKFGRLVAAYTFLRAEYHRTGRGTKQEKADSEINKALAKGPRAWMHSATRQHVYTIDRAFDARVYFDNLFNEIKKLPVRFPANQGGLAHLGFMHQKLGFDQFVKERMRQSMEAKAKKLEKDSTPTETEDEDTN